MSPMASHVLLLFLGLVSFIYIVEAQITPSGFPCDSNPCQNGGTCRNRNSNTRYTCTCPDGYEGTLCQVAPDFVTATESTLNTRIFTEPTSKSPTTRLIFLTPTEETVTSTVVSSTSTPTSRVPSTVPSTTDSGPGIKPESKVSAGVTYEHGILIAMGFVILLLFIAAIFLLCCFTRRKKSNEYAEATEKDSTLNTRNTLRIDVDTGKMEHLYNY